MSLHVPAAVTVLVLPAWRSCFAGLVVRVVVEDVVTIHLGHQVEALGHAVGGEARLRVVVPALRDGVTQEAHSLQSEGLELREPEADLRQSQCFHILLRASCRNGFWPSLSAGGNSLGELWHVPMLASCLVPPVLEQRPQLPWNLRDSRIWAQVFSVLPGIWFVLTVGLKQGLKGNSPSCLSLFRSDQSILTLAGTGDLQG